MLECLVLVEWLDDCLLCGWRWLTDFGSCSPLCEKLAPQSCDDHSKEKQAHYLREPLQGYGQAFSNFSLLISPPEGVLVAKKDFNAPKHEELDVPNLQVIKALQSLNSKNFVKTQFSWQWYYYVLTPEGVDYLRKWFVCLVFWLFSLFKGVASGSISLRKSYPQHTKRPFALLALLLVVLVEEKALTALPVVVTVMGTARRKKVHPANLDHNLLVLEGVLLGNELGAISQYFFRSSEFSGMSMHVCIQAYVLYYPRHPISQTSL